MYTNFKIFVIMIRRLNTLIKAALLMLMLPFVFNAMAQDQFWVNGIHYEVNYQDDYFII